MASPDELENEENVASLLEVSRTPEGRAFLGDAGTLAATLRLLPSSPPRLLLLRLRLLRNLCAGDSSNQDSFVLLSGVDAVAAAILPSPSPEIARAGLQVLGNVSLNGDMHRAAVWDRLFPSGFAELSRVGEPGVVDPLCMVLDTCTSGEGGHRRLHELVDEAVGVPMLAEIVATALRVGHKEEWLEWLLFKVCVEEQKFASLFVASGADSDVESSDGGELFNSKHAFLLGALSKCLSERPEEVTVSYTFALDILNVLKNAADIVDFTSRGCAPLPTDSPPIDVLGYSLLILRDICAWDHATPGTEEAPIDSLLKAGLIKLVLTFLGELEPPTTIRKSMAREQGTQPSISAYSRVCPYKGYRRDLVSIIANCLRQRKQVRDEVRQLNGILLLLQQCVLDEENEYLREWGLLAVKNLLEGNVENQNEVAQLELQEPVITPEVAELGLRVEVDKQAGRARLVNMS